MASRYRRASAVAGLSLLHLASSFTGSGELGLDAVSVVTIVDTVHPMSTCAGDTNESWTAGCQDLWLDLLNTSAAERTQHYETHVHMGSELLWDPILTHPAMVATARTVQEVQDVLRIVKRDGLDLSIRNTGADWHGRYTRPGSLQLWLHEFQDEDIPFEDFTTCSGIVHELAFTTRAGTQWSKVIPALTAHGRYGMFGTSPLVGASGGHVQGGGFSSLGGRYGTVADNVLEMGVVLASGDYVVADACNNEELFWALRGGGGGTFGVVTHVVHRSFPGYVHMGEYTLDVKADDPAVSKQVRDYFLETFWPTLDRSKWVTYAFFFPIALHIEGYVNSVPESEVNSHWAALNAFSQSVNASFSLNVTNFPLGPLGTASYPIDNIGRALGGHIGHEYGAWLRPEDITGGGFGSFIDTALGQMYAAGDPAPVIRIDSAKALHGVFQGEASTSVNPEAYQADMYVYANTYPKRGRIQSLPPSTWPESVQHVHEDPIIRAMYWADNGNLDALDRGGVYSRVAAALYDAFPSSGSYTNENDPFHPGDWRKNQWGRNYDRLLAIKNKVDPHGLFTCRRCVGFTGDDDDDDDA